MKLKDIEKNNTLARKKTRAFRKQANLRSNRVHTEEFHHFRNTFPYYGLAEILIDDCEPFVMYSNNDDLVAQTYFWYGANSYERKSVAEWVSRSRQCASILDVGAFTGLFAMAAQAANPNATIHAFEATRRVYGRLVANLQANHWQKAVVSNNFAISDKENQVTFYQYRGEHVLGTGASFIDKGIQIFNQDETVRTQALDAYVAEHNIKPELFKIDVEGAEAMVLNGMNSILDQYKPQIIIEVSPNTINDVSQKLKQFGYRLFYIDEGSMSLTETDGSSIKEFCNILAET